MSTLIDSKILSNLPYGRNTIEGTEIEMLALVGMTLGQEFLNTDDNTYYTFNGTVWQNNTPLVTEDTNTVLQNLGAAFVTLTSMTRLLQNGTYIVNFSGWFTCVSDDIGEIDMFLAGVSVGGAVGYTTRRFGGLVLGTGVLEAQFPVDTQALVTVSGGAKTLDIQGKEVSGTDVNFQTGTLIIQRIK